MTLGGLVYIFDWIPKQTASIQEHPSTLKRMSEGYGWDITVRQPNYWQKLAETGGLLSSWVTQTGLRLH